jgi:hypothetical protein
MCSVPEQPADPYRQQQQQQQQQQWQWQEQQQQQRQDPLGDVDEELEIVSEEVF